jgi:hypothetical protein
LPQQLRCAKVLEERYVAPRCRHDLRTERFTRYLREINDSTSTKPDHDAGNHDCPRSALVRQIGFWCGSGGSRFVFAIAAYTLLVALTLSPLFFTPIPPLVDYPDHLARMWILIHGSENYQANWYLLPALAMDLIVPPLAQIMPVETAGRLFIALTMALPVIATVVLHRALFGRVGLWPMCSLLFVYNAALYWGLLNFLFGLGVALLGFSGWAASERWHTITRVTLFAIVACLLFILHLFALGIYGLLVGFYEIGSMFANGRRPPKSIIAQAAKFAQFGPVILLWLVSLPTTGPLYTSYGNAMAKIAALGAPLALGEVKTSAIFSVLLIGFFYITWRNGALKLSPAMRLPIVAMIVAAVLMPDWLYSSWAADIRLPVALPFVLIGSTQLNVRRGKVAGVLGALALVFLGIRVYALTLTWRDIDSRFAEFRLLSRTIPRGARVLVVESDIPDSDRRVDGIPRPLASVDYVHFTHMPSLAVMDRDAFIPYQLTGWTPIKPTLRNAGRFVSQDVPLKPEELVESLSPEWQQRYAGVRNVHGETHYALNWPEKFEYVLWINFGQRQELLADKLKLVASGSFFDIYQILR